jgi:hypothetical protein
MRREIRGRFWIEAAIAIAGTALLVLTLVEPQWIERVFGVDPDAGSGALELAISVGLILVAGISWLLAAMEWRTARQT